MPRFAANLSMMFNEVPFLDRFAAAAEAGFKGVEFLFPYDHPAADIRSRLDDAGLALALFNMPPGDWAAGERGTAGLPGRQAEFRDGVQRAIDYAGALGCPLLHCMAGIAAAGAVPGAHFAAYVANVAWAAERTAAAGLRLVLEPINHRDMPGYVLNTTGEAAGIVEALGRDRVALQFDLYHCQITEGDLIRHMEALMPIIGHVQIADVPGRNEPGTGEINWANVLPCLDALGYQGWVGCEYRPAAGTVAGLTWRNRY
jgi:hydroxypyruvate isomerase